MEMELPPGVTEENGSLFRTVKRTAADGAEWEQRRPVALTLAEAKERRFDYYHPQYGWILEGYKLARDRTPESIIGDESMGGAPLPSEPERPAWREQLASATRAPQESEGGN